MTPAEIQFNLRTRRKACGQCLYCRNPARPKKTTCQSCQQRRSKSVVKYRQKNKLEFNTANRNRHHKKKISRICTRCSNEAKQNKILCSTCRSNVSKIQKRSYENKKAQSKCINCGKHTQIGVLCNACSSTKQVYHQRAEIKQHNRKYREENWRSVLLSTLKARAKKRSIDIDPNLSMNDIPDPTEKKCPVFNCVYVMGSRNKHAFSATVDRINHKLGYIKGNLQLLSSLANDIKSNADPGIIRRVGLAVLKKENSKIKNKINKDESTKIRRQKMISQKKSSNKHKRKLEFTIEWQHLTLPIKCPCTGIRVDYDNLSNDWKSKPSIDRINNDLGYVPENTWVISALANAIKSSATGSQILMVANWLKNQSL